VGDWREIRVTGHPSRRGIDRDVARGGTTELMLPSDLLGGFCFSLGEELWVVELRLTGFRDSEELPTGPDEPMVAVTYVGTIDGTDIRVEIDMIGEVLDHFRVEGI